MFSLFDQGEIPTNTGAEVLPHNADPASLRYQDLTCAKYLQEVDQNLLISAHGLRLALVEQDERHEFMSNEDQLRLHDFQIERIIQGHDIETEREKYHQQGMLIAIPRAVGKRQRDASDDTSSGWKKYKTLAPKLSTASPLGPSFGFADPEPMAMNRSRPAYGGTTPKLIEPSPLRNEFTAANSLQNSVLPPSGHRSRAPPRIARSNYIPKTHHQAEMGGYKPGRIQEVQDLNMEDLMHFRGTAQLSTFEQQHAETTPLEPTEASYVDQEAPVIENLHTGVSDFGGLGSQGEENDEASAEKEDELGESGLERRGVGRESPCPRFFTPGPIDAPSRESPTPSQAAPLLTLEPQVPNQGANSADIDFKRIMNDINSRGFET
ncbi:MAG: hypothetical protein Q9220_004151 [cf. Caloplaca sp. 1 TL-2023]